MSKLGKAKRELMREARKAGDLDALLSGNPATIARHWANKLIGRVVHHVTGPLFLKKPRGKNRR